jgi:hypothetical protein
LAAAADQGSGRDVGRRAMMIMVVVLWVGLAGA